MRKGQARAESQAESQTSLRIRRLRRSELPVGTIELARYLIGKTLVRDLPRGRVSGRIVETEAYPVGDAAAHAFRGKTPRNRSLYLPHGHAYVFFTYGSCFMMNVSSEADGVGAGVLIRALEPIEGISYMEKQRGTNRLLDLTRGPGRLAEAMGIDKRYDGLNLCSRNALWLGSGVRAVGPIRETIRIGITRDAHRLYRFYELGSPFVSGSKRLLQ